MRLISLITYGLFLGSFTWLAGCGANDSEFKRVEPDVPVKENHAHHHEHAQGPHEGHLIELGDEEYHAELVFDEKTKTISVYILGSDPNESHAIEAKSITLKLSIEKTEVAFALEASPKDGDPEGKSSRYVLANDEKIATHIHDAEELEGQVEITIDGTDFTGKISHEHE